MKRLALVAIVFVLTACSSTADEAAPAAETPAEAPATMDSSAMDSTVSDSAAVPPDTGASSM
jgi:uncharacterized lipoprotein YajG